MMARKMAKAAQHVPKRRRDRAKDTARGELGLRIYGHSQNRR
jgi:hypothetical protein